MSVETRALSVPAHIAWIVAALSGCAYPVNDLGYSPEAGSHSTGGASWGTGHDGGLPLPDAGKASGGTSGFGATGGTSASGGGGSAGFGGGFGGSFGGSSAGGFGGASSCSVTLSDPICSGCMETQCCGYAELCVGNTDCVGLMQCPSASYNCDSVTSAAEYAACAAGECPQYASGQSALVAYFGCMDASCTGACQ